MTCSDLFQRPLPPLFDQATATDYHSIPIALDHPESSEPLVTIESFGVAGESYYARTDGQNAPYERPLAGALSRIFCRRSVAERLAQINNRLAPLDLELFVLDAYRSVACQRALWDFFTEAVKKQSGDLTPEQQRKIVNRYVSDPSRFDRNDSTTWPTHATGGAVDLTIRNTQSGELLVMGGAFDDPSEVSHTRYYEDRRGDSEAARNRRLLFWLMIEAGFANYAYEWWHFDFGTQMWAMNRSMLPGESSALIAFYGLPAEIPAF